MFSLNCKHFIHPEMARHVKEQNNKWFKNYSNNNVFKTHLGLKVTDLVKQKNNESFFFNSQYIFISLISFLVGYNFRYLIKQD